MATMLRATRLKRSRALWMIFLFKTPCCPWTGRCAGRAPWKKDASRGHCPSTPPWSRVSEREKKGRKIIICGWIPEMSKQQNHYRSVTPDGNDGNWVFFFATFAFILTVSKTGNVGSEMEWQAGERSPGVERASQQQVTIFKFWEVCQTGWDAVALQQRGKREKKQQQKTDRLWLCRKKRSLAGIANAEG